MQDSLSNHILFFVHFPKNILFLREDFRFEVIRQLEQFDKEIHATYQLFSISSEKMMRMGLSRRIFRDIEIFYETSFIQKTGYFSLFAAFRPQFHDNRLIRSASLEVAILYRRSAEIPGFDRIFLNGRRP
jgi:hypothetical protein